MTTIRRLLVSLLLAIGTTSAAADAAKFVTGSETEPVVARYLVTLSELASEQDVQTVSSSLAAHYGVRLEPYVREGFRGFMIVSTPRKARLLSSDARVSLVEEQPEQPAPASVSTAPVASSTIFRPVTHAEGSSRNLGTYDYDGTGNIRSITGDYGTEAFDYDTLGRVRVATLGSTSTGQEYEYDRYGNLTLTRTAGVTTPRRFAVDPATNHIDLAADATANVLGSYTPSGSLASVTWKELNQTATFAWDATNLVTESNVFGTARTYVYDANDERIVTIDATGERWTLRGLGGQVVRRFFRGTAGSLQWEEDYVYRGRAMLAAFVPGPEKVLHFHLDHLGSPRLITGNGGALVSEHRYYPFGEEVTAQNQYPEAKKFTGHERDSSAMGAIGGLDYMHARYYGTALGRFLSVDPGGYNLRQPQIWNRYSYVVNNPLRYVDPTGRCVQIPGQPPCTDMTIYVFAPDPWSSFWGDFFWFSSGVMNAFGSDLALGRGRVELDDPAYRTGQLVGDASAMVFGLLEINAGFGGEIGGFALDLTGVGALVGVPVQVVSGVVIVHGGTTTAIGAAHLMSGIKQRKAGKHGTFRGRDSKRANDAPVDRVVRELGLTRDERQRLHQEIQKSGGGLSYEEILDMAKSMFPR